ncbi:MAG: hypothetical protein ACYTG2_03100 [Planctomycetota bacterium]
MAFVIFTGLALFLLRDGLRPGTVMLSGETLQRSLPWSAVLPEEPAHNRFVGDQARIYFPYLMEAAAVYRGEADAVWTPRGGGGLPFLGNMTSSLLHPLTALAGVLALPLVPLVQALAVLILSAQLTFLFLRRLGLRWAPAVCGGLAFGFGGHQVLWLQYALSHTLVALPLCFWAVERLVEDRSRRRVAVLAAGFALLVLGGHPETAYISGLVALLWALWRLWDAHGRFLVVGTALLGAALSAVQWLPFLEYAKLSHGSWLRSIEAARGAGGASLGAAAIFVFFLVGALALLRSSAERGFVKRCAAIVSGVVLLVMARRMGMAVAGGVLVLPGLYGSPVGDGVYSGAQDYPGLDAGYVGVLPVLLLGCGALVGLGGGFVRFFALGALVLWGAAFHMPGAEGAVRLVPGLSQLGSTRLLGPVGFMAACGGAMVLDELCARLVKPGIPVALGRMAVTLLLVFLAALAALRIPVDPHGGRTLVPGLIEPTPDDVHDGSAPVAIVFPLAEAADDLRVMVDGRLLRSGRAAASAPGEPLRVMYDAQRAEEGRHRLRVETIRDGRPQVLADQPLAIHRDRRVAPRDALMLLLSISLLAVACVRPRPWIPGLAVLLIAVDVISFGDDYNTTTPAERLYPPTETAAFLEAQPGPFRIFTEGTIIPPDTQFAIGVEHILSYDNLGFHRTYQWLINAGIDMDAFATFSFSRANVDYASRRFDSLDVRYVLTNTTTDLSDVEGFELVHESETRVWENTQNLGRVFLVGEALDLTEDPPEVLFAADPGATALLEAPLESPLGGHGSARVVRREGGSLYVEAESEGHTLLVLAENRGPGWLASVDGGPEQATMACNVAWQAVPLGPGAHSVVLRPDSPAFRLGRLVSVVAAGLWLLMLLLPRQLS